MSYLIGKDTDSFDQACPPFSTFLLILFGKSLCYAFLNIIQNEKLDILNLMLLS